jgi:hypothetical protein
MNKYDRFWQANHEASDIVGQVAGVWGYYGGFAVDNADIILKVSQQELIAPELLAVTWPNESSFTFYCEPNKNNSPAEFPKWDVGPMQLNVWYTREDIRVGFVKADGIDLDKAFGTPADLFNGDPVENIRLGARKLKALGRAAVIGKNKGQIAEKLSVEEWKTTPEDIKNLRRAMLYTRPDARNARYDSYNRFAPLFKKFFEIYKNQE